MTTGTGEIAAPATADGFARDWRELRADGDIQFERDWRELRDTLMQVPAQGQTVGYTMGTLLPTLAARSAQSAHVGAAAAC